MQSIKDFFDRRYAQKPGLCFVLMPFRPPLDEIYDQIIKPTIETMCNMECRRADDIYSSKPVIGDIWEYIQKAEIIIADLTGKNPNVLYELGLSHALCKRVILLAPSTEDVPFDLRHFRFIIYEQSFNREKLAQDLSKAVSSICEETINDEDANRVGMEITYPKDGQTIYGEFAVEGKFKNRPTVPDVRAFVASTSDKRIWPQGSVVFNTKRKTWSCEVNLWEHPKNETCIFIAGLGKDGTILCNYYGVVGTLAHWPPLPELTSDVVEYDRVMIINGFHRRDSA